MARFYDRTYKQLTVQIEWKNITGWKPSEKVIIAHLENRIPQPPAGVPYNIGEEYLDDEISTYKTVSHKEDSFTITTSDAVELYNMNFKEEYQSALSYVTGSSWFSSSVTAKGFYVTGSMPRMDGLDFPVFPSSSTVINSSDHNNGLIDSYTQHIQKSQSLYYVSCSADYNRWMAKTGSCFYVAQQRL